MTAPPATSPRPQAPEGDDVPGTTPARAADAPAPLRAGDIVRYAAWCALAGALLQLVFVAVRKYLLGTMVLQNPQIVWMAPVALLALFTLPAALFMLGARLWPRLVTRRLVLWTFVFLAAVNIALMYERLHKVAILVLAAGAATQLVRTVATRSAGFDRLVRRSLPLFAALVALMGVGLNGWRALAERRALAALPPARAGAPNVLLIILDTVRSASLSLHGYARRTSPLLETLGERGVVFDNAIATAPWTLPSHASVFTGLWTHEHGATWNTALDDAHPVLAEALAARGYRTGGFVANLTFTTREYGLSRGFARYDDYPWTLGELAMNAPLVSAIANRPELRRLVGHYDGLSRRGAAEITGEALAFVDEDRSRPWFAFLNLFEAHDPYLPHAPFDTLFGPVAVRGNEKIRLWARGGGRLNKEQLTRPEVDGMVAAYDGAIAEADYEVGRLLDSLRARGVLENTIVLVTSDHGELFGEHGLFEHAKTPYMPVIHVPLVVSWPGRVPEGVRVAQPVSIREIPASLVALADSTAPSPFPGTPLQRVWSGGATVGPVLSELAKDPTAQARGQTAGTQRVLALVSGQWHYLRSQRGAERLYDYAADPGEERDLARLPEHRGTLLRMRAQTDSMLSAREGAPVARR